MTQEEKQILLIDLCARMPYGVKCRVFLDIDNYIINESDKYSDSQLETINCLSETYTFTHLIGYNFGKFSIEHVKPYLRPMSSMTKEEYEEYYNISYGMSNIGSKYEYYDLCDWFNKHHFDYRGLIEKGLALESPEGMYTLNK